MFNSCRMSTRMLPSELASDREPGLIQKKCIETRGMEHAPANRDCHYWWHTAQGCMIIVGLQQKRSNLANILWQLCHVLPICLRSTHFWLRSGLRPPACPISGRSPSTRPRWDCSSRATSSHPGPVVTASSPMGRWADGLFCSIDPWRVTNITSDPLGPKFPLLLVGTRELHALNVECGNSSPQTGPTATSPCTSKNCRNQSAVFLRNFLMSVPPPNIEVRGPKENKSHFLIFTHYLRILSLFSYTVGSTTPWLLQCASGSSVVGKGVT